MKAVGSACARAAPLSYHFVLWQAKWDRFWRTVHAIWTKPQALRKAPSQTRGEEEPPSPLEKGTRPRWGILHRGDRASQGHGGHPTPRGSDTAHSPTWRDRVVPRAPGGEANTRRGARPSATTSSAGIPHLDLGEFEVPAAAADPRHPPAPGWRKRHVHSRE